MSSNAAAAVVAATLFPWKNACVAEVAMVAAVVSALAAVAIVVEVAFAALCFQQMVIQNDFLH